MINIVSDSDNPLFSAALNYASRGWRVFPCHFITKSGVCSCSAGAACGNRKGKHPRTPNGCKDATTDPAQIEKWWRECPTANVGIATGKASNLLVLDWDKDKGGLQTFEEIKKDFGFPKCSTVRTGAGGLHHYFVYPKDSKYTVATGVMPGLDYRGEGGYVIAPPSNHHSGASYEWLISPEICKPADAPVFLQLLLDKPEKKQKPKEKPKAVTGERSSASPLRFTIAETEDFASHAGAKEGARNATLCRLAGVHLSRGDSPQTIETLGLAWGRKCSPPIDEAEALRTLRSLAKNHRPLKPEQEQEQAPAEPELEPIQAPAEQADKGYKEALPSSFYNEFAEPKPKQEQQADDWPILADAAMHGLIGEIIQAVSPETEADPAGVLLSLLTCFGASVGKGAWASVGADIHPANLFCCLIGNTSSGKGQTWSIANLVMNNVDEHWPETVAKGLASGEGLIQRVRDELPEKDKDGNTIKFTIPPEKRLLSVETEFSKLLKVSRRDGNTLSERIRDAWDGQPLESFTRIDPMKANNAHIGMIGHCTPNELSSMLSGGKAVELFNGWANRYLWCLVRSTRRLPFGGNMKVLTPFYPRLKEALAFARGAGQITFSAEAAPIWDAVYYDALKNDRGGAWGSATGRARPQTLRLCLLYALLDKSNVIAPVHLDAAIAVWNYCCDSAKRLFGGNDDGLTPLAARLLVIIRAKAGINRRQLFEELGNNEKSFNLQQALNELTSKGLAHARTVATGGRPGECWYAGAAPADSPP